MAYKFTDEDKVETNFSGNYFPFGTHKVSLGAIENGGQGDGEKEYIELTVLGNNDEEDTARVWFTTEKSANYAFNTLRQIAVHSGKDEVEKGKIRDAIDACQDTDELVKLFNEKLIGCELWFTVYPSPNRTYTATDGTVKKSIDKNVYGYEPKARDDLLPADQQSLAASDFPGAEPATGAAADGIPGEWK